MSRLFITIILLFGAVVVGLFYLVPEWQNVGKIKGSVDRLSEINNEFGDLVQTSKDLINTINKISQEDLSRIDEALPRGSKAADFVVLLERLAIKNGMVLKQIDITSAVGSKPQAAVQQSGTVKAAPKSTGALVGAEVGGKEIYELPFSFAVNGTYENFKKFLMNTEKSLRINDIEGISFSSPGKPEAFGTTLKAKIYHQ